MKPKATDTLVRAARELLRWDQKMLAAKSGVGLATVRRFETGANTQPAKIEAIASALQAAGVAFLGPDSPARRIVEGVALTPAGKPLDRPTTRVYKRVKSVNVATNEAAATPSPPLKRPKGKG